MRSNHIAMSLVIDAPIEKVWEALADWESQGDWMLQTTVEVTSDIREGVGTSIAAFTGPLHMFYPRLKSLGFLDLMVVTQWQPPHRCDVDHVGKVLKGSGSFQLSEINSSSTRFDWSETIVAPKAIFLLVAPFLYVGVRISLARFARSFT